MTPDTAIPDSTANTVLLLTHQHDFYTLDRVADALRARGADPVRIDTDRFPLELAVQMQFVGDTLDATLHCGSRRIAASQVRAVWLRHFGAPDVGDAVDAQFRAACNREAHLVMEGFLEALPHARWLNPYRAVAPAEAKLRQLRVAQLAGLRIPATLVSNRADPVLPFFESLPGGMVMKLQAPLSQSMDGSGPAFYTTALQRGDLDDLSGLHTCPTLFQERIAKACELRVVYVAGRCFAGSLVARANANGREGCDDWRAQRGLCWQNDALPPAVAACFGDFMQRMGLNFGAADFIRTPDGEHVFLEVNPCGEWGMLERDLGLPIARAIADALLDGPATCPLLARYLPSK